MEKYLKIGKVNWKYNLKYHFIIAILFCCSSYFIMGLENLDIKQSAVVLEMYISLIGIILLIPAFNLDQNRDISDLIRTKKQSVINTFMMQTIEAIFLLILIEIIYILFLKKMNCQFPILLFLYGVLASSMFMGAIGIVVYSLSNNVVISYMVPILYYIINYFTGSKYVGIFYLFSISNNSFMEKIVLFISSILLIIFAGLFRAKHKI